MDVVQPGAGNREGEPFSAIEQLVSFTRSSKLNSNEEAVTKRLRAELCAGGAG